MRSIAKPFKMASYLFYSFFFAWTMKRKSKVESGSLNSTNTTIICSHSSSIAHTEWCVWFVNEYCPFCIYSFTLTNWTNKCEKGFYRHPNLIYVLIWMSKNFNLTLFPSFIVFHHFFLKVGNFCSFGFFFPSVFLFICRYSKTVYLLNVVVGRDINSNTIECGFIAATLIDRIV